MEDEVFDRFRQRYWQAVRPLAAVQPCAWERSRLTLPELPVLSAIRRRPGITIGAGEEA